MSWSATSSGWEPAEHRPPPGYLPPAAFAPSVAAPAPTPSRRRPRYRESRPVRWWTVLIGVGVALLYYVLLALVSWSVGSFIVLMLLGVAAAAVLVWLLVARGDTGAGVGAAAVSGFALATLVSVLAWRVFDVAALLAT